MTILLELGKGVVLSPLLLIGGIFGAMSVYVSLVILYRLTFHPLAKCPGPFLAKVTDLYLAYHAWKGDRHLEFYRCHEKYGKISQGTGSTISTHDVKQDPSYGSDQTCSLSIPTLR